MQVEFSVSSGRAEVLLNRPEAINALNLGMLHAIEDQLGKWFEEGAITEITLDGVGERGFCSGADVRDLASLAGIDPSSALRVLRDEYRVVAMVINSPVPVTARLHGVSMGAGLGLGMHTARRIGFANTQWAMPEVGIGLWPDVGVCYELAHAPGEIGSYLAMTGNAIDGASALFAGLIDESPDPLEPDSSQLAADVEWINECFTGNDPVEILTRLENSIEPAANSTAALIRKRCPLSVCVALEAVRRAKELSGALEVLDQDLLLASHFMESPDFIEGVRAQIIDKDRNPHWSHARIEDVTRAEVESQFR